MGASRSSDPACNQEARRKRSRTFDASTGSNRLLPILRQTSTGSRFSRIYFKATPKEFQSSSTCATTKGKMFVQTEGRHQGAFEESEVEHFVGSITDCCISGFENF